MLSTSRVERSMEVRFRDSRTTLALDRTAFQYALCIDDLGFHHIVVSQRHLLAMEVMRAKDTDAGEPSIISLSE